MNGEAGLVCPSSMNAYRPCAVKRSCNTSDQPFDMFREGMQAVSKVDIPLHPQMKTTLPHRTFTCLLH
ncbi:hypothetical protein TNCV_3572971 [Trichonephila clavipes]|nr:hypothetical protein TNCV_3572971 [Trichonephila clavipes]